MSEGSGRLDEEWADPAGLGPAVTAHLAENSWELLTAKQALPNVNLRLSLAGQLRTSATVVAGATRIALKHREEGDSEEAWALGSVRADALHPYRGVETIR